MRSTISLLIVLGIMLLSACVESTPAPAAEESSDQTGALALVANGEDFVRQGFVTKDGWQVDFDHVYVTLADVTAYRTDPPFDASSGSAPDGEAIAVAGPITLDLAEGDENADPIVVDTVDAVAGQYNAMGWRMIPGEEGDTAGATITLVGTAQKDGESIAFTLMDMTEYTYNCGEYVGEGRKGIVEAAGSADIEATFHFDHVFGDADAPADDALNVGALGFDPLAALAQDGVLETSVAELADLLSEDDYGKLVDTLATLGHVGEGHCYEATGGYTGHSE